MSDAERQNENGRSGPLSSLRVLELGHFIAGPHATRMLADFGAEVIKVEQPRTGDPMRKLGKTRDGHGLWWSSLSRNKKLVTLDISRSGGQSVLRRLAAECDVVVENFRAGQLERWGIGPDELRRGNPGLIVARVSGFGQSGPYADRLSLASIGEAAGGLHFITGDPAKEDSPPIRASISLGDTVAALYTVIGILAALNDSRARRRGCDIDIAMYEAVFGLLESAVTEYGTLGHVRRASGSSSPNFSPSNFYRSADCKWICMAATGDSLFARLAALVGQPLLVSDSRFDTNDRRVANRVALDAIISEWTEARSADDIIRLFAQAGIPASKVFSVEDAVSDPHYRARGAVLSVEDATLGTVLHPGIFPKFSGPGSEPVIRTAGGALGRDNIEVFQRILGMSAEEIEQMTASRLI
jgi:crotonobetainyl-CoA:carnitine CoA-transferase CaiB-like acyl-CoA transferase